MWMGANIHAGAQQKFVGTHLVKEDEWTDHLALRRRQRAAHLEAADIPTARNNHRFNEVAGKAIARLGVFSGLPAHHITLVWLPLCRHRCRSRGMKSSGFLRIADSSAVRSR